MIRTLREAPEVGSGSCTHIDVEIPPGVLAHRADGPTGTMVFLQNLGTEDVTVDLGSLFVDADLPNDVLADREYAPVGKLDALKLAGYGYRWIRLRRNPGGWAGPAAAIA
jgi:maltose alpha-D-glucosyltransferase / alpha-amylase